MNHDYTHCFDYKPTCPKDCFRAQITKDYIESNYPYPVSFTYLKETDECKLKESQDE